MLNMIYYVLLFWIAAGIPAAVLIRSFQKLGWMNLSSDTDDTDDTYTQGAQGGGLEEMIIQHETFWFVLIPTVVILGPAVWFAVFILIRSKIERQKETATSITIAK